MKLYALAIAAHPDDIELSCSGTIIKLTHKGYPVGILDLTRGELGTRGNEKIREEEAKEAASLMGVKVRENLELPDGGIEVTQKNKIELIKIIRKYKPDIIFAPYWVERHPDHENTSKLVREAWYLSGLAKLKTKLNGKSQEPFRPKKIFFYVQYFYQQFTPNLIIDISDVFDKKIKVIECYKSQFFNPSVKFNDKETLLSTPDFKEYLIARARFFGEMIGRKYGEPFLTLSPIGLNGIDDVILPERS
ncbi:bacillithiol biosynthesis deacetylase BshB1 [Candidatus Kryptobacter tengchongensis]|uniref:Bacillithiol biosynthesis deacetylase BshB1 n=1 Tax=Kryptobacter tengchongensis TaxID=1643429 RepID=A0A656CXK3_KRYT1|nr:bacillithiol biosynthesis deacetylase BshB1 [Candidatus Kryptobacter tengchongensis]CUS78545.1 bacillithiol biosynthesis deacetylase BshB1 [Candidatus Kryptobacter tengchongensis]CUS99649.1 bacillithiol biosynthesis deacetylase BshB1 [Candidatus Kryptobacter tengchongensis]CUT00630.1 bacillithiol biosynthesis deacetylase BshB1 [Candidatus Kryptobacter tengchongensis]CUU07711.1 bacillithiol biosynthesis deacetylase BshB1 [Candidatus Kryptobacter tengchongensis]